MTQAPEISDYVVVGAGSAGCVVANKLSADPTAKVTLIEAGSRDTSPWIHIPVGYFRTMHNPAFDWCYATEPDEGIGGRALDCRTVRARQRRWRLNVPTPCRCAASGG